MTKYFVLFILICSLSSEIQAQNTDIYYKIFPKDILKDKQNIDQQTRRLVEGGANYAKKEEYILKINDSLSIFSKVNKLISFDDPLKDIHEGIAKNFTNFNNQTLYNFNKNQITYNISILNNAYTVKQEPMYFDWKLTNDQKEILGYNAQKAEGVHKDILTGKTFKIEAWFIRDVLISTGPDVFMGLPGLIVELDLPRSIIRISKIEKTNKVDINLKINVKQAINRDQFDKIIGKLNNKVNEINN
jgi:GLPGLI family protein